MAEFLNEKPFEHNSRFGTRFRATRCDFAEGVAVYVPSTLSQAQLFSDVSEMVGVHATIIHERLNGFQGYDCIRYIFR